ncbi:MAG: hypothetical protein AAGF20_11555, partial [Pseudomonadota bacterium]
MFKTVLVALAFTAATACTSVTTQAVGQSPTSDAGSETLTGVYAGTYTCSRGENGITVSLDKVTPSQMSADTAMVEARLWFYDTQTNPNHPSGAFKLSGVLIGERLELKPAGWISVEPVNWGAAGITGT